MEFDGVTNKFRASTRSGATLEFDKHDLISAIKHREEPGVTDEEAFHALQSRAESVAMNIADKPREKGSGFIGNAAGS